MDSINVIILAAGGGERFGCYKQFERVRGRTILEHTVAIYKPFSDRIIVVKPNDYVLDSPGNIVVTGGKTRFESIRAGFRWVDYGKKIIVVDAVRCNTPHSIVQELVTTLDDCQVAFPVLRAVNTVCIWDDGVEVYTKKHMYDIQTPTACQYDVMKKIIEEGSPDWGFSIVYAADRLGVKPMMPIPGDGYNFKITYPADLEFFKLLKKTQAESEPLIPDV